MARLALAIIAVAAIAAPARAGNEEDARSAMERGVAALDAHQDQEALDEFERAIELVPEAPMPYKFAGEALERLERWADAIARYQKYLDVWPAAADAGDVKDRIARIEATHRGRVAIECRPGATVEIDGVARGVTPLDPVPVDVGEHRVQLRAAGHLPWSRTATVDPGAEVTVPCKLVPQPPPAPPRPVVDKPRPARPRPSPPWYRRRWVWAVAAGSAAVIAGGVGYVVLTDLPDTEGGDISYPHPHPR